MPPFYQVKVVENDGTVIQALARANAKRCSWVVNEPGVMSFDVHPLDSEAGALRTAGAEVQLWRDGDCIWWGRPKRAFANKSTVSYECAGLLDWLSELYFGPITLNAATNPGFESSGASLTGWTAQGCTPSVSSTIRYMGDRAAKLIASGAGADDYLHQTQSFTAGAVGLRVFASARVYIETFAAAYQQRGLYLGYDSADAPAANVIWDPITPSTGRGRFVKIKTSLPIGVSLTKSMQLRLYAPGTVYWDDVVWTVMESVSTTLDGQEDAAGLVASMLGYLQSKAGHLNMALTNPTTGTKLIRTFQFYESLNALEEFQRFGAEGICDIKVAHDATTRTFTIYPGEKGSLKSSYPLKVDVDDEPGSAINFDWQTDLDAASNRGWIMGEDEGAFRDLAIAEDLTALGGTLQEFVVTAPSGTPKSSLQRLVNAELARRKKIPETPSATVPAASWLGNVEEGDTVPVTFDYGWAQLTSNRRVVALELDCVTDTIRPTVNS